ncbi:hypothetical protein BH11VER1_BH11VER1_42280 [soil metagenome]
MNPTNNHHCALSNALCKSFAQCLLLFTLMLSPLPAQQPGEALKPAGSTMLFYGNSMVERLLEQGELEAYLQLAQPRSDLHVRSLAWTGDEVGYRLRPEGYVEHLKTLLTRWPANTVVLGYGMNESFAGQAGLSDFRKQWEVYFKEITRLYPQAKVVMLSPIAVDAARQSLVEYQGTTKSGDTHLDIGVSSYAKARNTDLAAYTQAMSEIAKMHGAQFIDLYAASLEAYKSNSVPLTIQGIHLNDTGNRIIAKVIARSLLGEEKMNFVDTSRIGEVAKAAAQKSSFVADVVRPKNGVVYYGVRKRPEENAVEMPRYHQLIDKADEILHELVRNPKAQFADFSRPSLPPLPEGKSIPDRFSGGIVKEPVEQQKDITVAEGYTLNLFASEAEFPELKAPVQMAFDVRGRLWVVTMPSFPHTLPGSTPQDKILILEDTNHDGKADKCTVFADGFDALDGVAFHEKGVIISAQPRLFILRDTNGDDRADTRTELLRGVDVTDSHHGGMVETDPLGDIIFCDGVFHRSQFETPFGVVRGIDATTYRLHPNSGRIETEWQGMTPNPWKVSFDRYGNIFQRFGGGHVLDGLPLTWTPLGVYHPYGNGTVVNYGKGSALSVVSSPNFPDAYQQGIASATLLGTYCVSISKPNADAGPIVGTDRLDLLTSQNSAFRPVDCEFGFDGALYVSDFSSRIIGHAQHPMRDPQWNHTCGRIWRVTSNEKPIVKEWPKIEGASVKELIMLLDHPQNIVRHHARIQLRGMGDEVIAALDQAQPVSEQATLEALWVLQSKGQVRPVLLSALLKSKDPMFRSAAVQLMRFQSAQLSDARAMLTAAARDPHPRVRMAVINTLSHLRANGHLDFDNALSAMVATEAPVKQMLDDLKAGTLPVKGRSVPVLEVAPETRVNQWILIEDTGSKAQGKTAAIKTKVYRTFLESEVSQTALLSVKHGYLDISANGVQLLSANSPYSSEQQVQIDLQKGLNMIEIAFRNVKPALPPVFVYDTLGQPLAGARMASDESELKALATSWNKLHDDGALHVQAVLNQMQFSPKELRAKAGQPVRIVFENPDLMPHNFVIIEPGAEDEIGTLADQMAAKPDGMTKGFIPVSPKILHASRLIEAKGKEELNFNAPAKQGRYPYLCTFPGHWRIMRGILVVE